MDHDLVKEVGKFDGGYGRVGVIDIRSDRTCNVCNAKARITLCADGSEGEYSVAAICSDCLKTILEKMKSRESDQR